MPAHIFQVLFFFKGVKAEDIFHLLFDVQESD